MENNKLEDFLTGEKSFWNTIIVLAILTVLVTGIIIVLQVLEAKNYCKSIDGEYSIKINVIPHRCNGEEIVKYEENWDFKKNTEVNWSNFQYKP